MKKILLLISFGFSVFTLSAQNWSALTTGVNGPVNAMAVYNGILYVGGEFDSAGSVSVQNIACWNGTTWTGLRGLRGAFYGYVNALCVYNGKLYVGGYFDSAGGVYAKNIASWDGTHWMPVSLGVYNGGISALCVHNNNLYAAGDFDSAGGHPAAGIAMYNGSGWTALAGGTHGGANIIQSLISYNGKLYVGGAFDSVGNIAANGIAAWDGSTWSNLGSGVHGADCNCNGYVYSMDVFYGNLYVVGSLNKVGGNIWANGGVGIWNGSQWSSPGSPGNYSVANWASVVWGTNLYVGGLGPDIYQWSGSGWDSIGYLIYSDTGIVYSMCVYNGALYAGGQFNYVGSVSAKNIAKCYGPLAVNEVNVQSAEVKVYPNPSNGVFTVQIATSQQLMPARAGSDGANSQIEVYNSLGQKVYTASLNPSKGGTSVTNISLPFGETRGAGIYMYRVISTTGSLVGEGKLVIQK